MTSSIRFLVLESLAATTVACTLGGLPPPIVRDANEAGPGALEGGVDPDAPDAPVLVGSDASATGGGTGGPSTGTGGLGTMDAPSGGGGGGAGGATWGTGGASTVDAPSDDSGAGGYWLSGGAISVGGRGTGGAGTGGIAGMGGAIPTGGRTATGGVSVAGGGPGMGASRQQVAELSPPAAAS